MSIVKQIIEEHGGKTKVKVSLDKGQLFPFPCHAILRKGPDEGESG
jgi:hypothetical protein